MYGRLRTISTLISCRFVVFVKQSETLSHKAQRTDFLKLGYKQSSLYLLRQQEKREDIIVAWSFFLDQLELSMSVLEQRGSVINLRSGLPPAQNINQDVNLGEKLKKITSLPRLRFYCKTWTRYKRSNHNVSELIKTKQYVQATIKKNSNRLLIEILLLCSVDGDRGVGARRIVAGKGTGDGR